MKILLSGSWTSPLRRTARALTSSWIPTIAVSSLCTAALLQIAFVTPEPIKDSCQYVPCRWTLQ